MTKTNANKATTAARPWLKSYPEGMPAEIGPLPAPSIGALLSDACKTYAGRPAYVLQASESRAPIEGAGKGPISAGMPSG